MNNERNNEAVAVGFLVGCVLGGILTLGLSHSVFFTHYAPIIEIKGACKIQCASENVEVRDKACYCLNKVKND